MNRIISGIAVAMCILTVGGPTGTAAADPGGGGCQLVGAATFAPNGPGALGAFGYSLTGTLGTCQASRAGAPTEGAIEVGQVITRSVPVTLADGTVVQGTANYQEPLATGSGVVPVNSCAAGTTAGSAVVTWSDGTTTVIDYTTTALAAGVGLQGTVVDSLTATLVAGSAQPAGTAPATYTVGSTSPVFPLGDGAAGLVAFTTDDPTGCTAESGLSAVDVEGVVGVGSTS